MPPPPKHRAAPPGRQLICQNRRARHDFAIEERLEAGMVLAGTEVKACRLGRAHLTDAFVQVLGGEAFLVGGHIEEYSFGNRFNHPPRRQRKLLLHRSEIDRLDVKLREKGLAGVPLSLFFLGGRVKCEIGVGRGKSSVDRRHSIRERETHREMERAMRTVKRGGS